jgi:hypothetical protein
MSGVIIVNAHYKIVWCKLCFGGKSVKVSNIKNINWDLANL